MTGARQAEGNTYTRRGQTSRMRVISATGDEQAGRETDRQRRVDNREAGRQTEGKASKGRACRQAGVKC